MMVRLLLWMISLYRLFLDPFMGHHCRFFPSCSNYAAQALRRHGAWKGCWLIFRRFLRCHPYGGGSGFDPVP